MRQHMLKFYRPFDASTAENITLIRRTQRDKPEARPTTMGRLRVDGLLEQPMHFHNRYQNRSDCAEDIHPIFHWNCPAYCWCTLSESACAGLAEAWPPHTESTAKLARGHVDVAWSCKTTSPVISAQHLVHQMHRLTNHLSLCFQLYMGICRIYVVIWRRERDSNPR